MNFVTKYLGKEARRSLTPQSIASGFCYGVVLVVFASLLTATLSHEFRLLRSSRVGEPYPMGIYGLMPAPGTSPVPGAPGAAGADFSQVYTSALALRHGESAYFPIHREFADRFRRPPNYPPLTNWIYVPLSLLPYYDALLVHTAISLLALFGTTAVVLWKAGLRRRIAPVLLLQSSLYFLTPIGLTHLERGQFDLLVAAATTLCVACVFIERGTFGLAALSGFLGALKWTSVPFLGCFSVVGFVLGSRHRCWAFFVILAVMSLATAVFWINVHEYWFSIRVFEIDAQPRGLTLQHFLPRPLAKVLPVLITLVVVGSALIRARSEHERDQLLFAISAPFGLALMNLAICYGAVSFEYRTVSTLGMIPGLVVWTEREPLLSKWVKLATCVAFGVFLCVAFRTFQFAGPYSWVAMTQTYSWFSAIFLGLCGYALLNPLKPISAPATQVGERAAPLTPLA